MRKSALCKCKTKTQISNAVTFVLAYFEIRFSHDVARMVKPHCSKFRITIADILDKRF